MEKEENRKTKNCKISLKEEKKKKMERMMFPLSLNPSKLSVP